jgi:DNA-binding response OmpR family regulator
MLAIDASLMNLTDGRFPRSTKPRRRVLLIDDEVATGRSVDGSFRDHGYELLVELDADRAVQRCRLERPDAVLLDFRLQGIDGIALCKQIRDATSVPLVVFTAWTDPFDRVVCLQLGADDYLTKPLEPRVLLAHIDALMRRAQHDVTVAQPRSTLEVGPYTVNRMERRVLYRGVRVNLAATEFELFWVLVNHYGNVVERRALERRLKMSDNAATSRALDGRAFRLRRRLEDAGAPPESVKAVRSRGLMLTAEVEMVAEVD